MEDLRDLDLLGITRRGYMNIYEYLGTTKSEVEDILLDLDNFYLSYPISKNKNSRSRWIDAPNGRLKQIQEALLYRFLYRFSLHESCVGFVKGKSVRTGAEKHLNKSQLLNMDLKDFFPTINAPKLAKLFKFLFARSQQAFPGTQLQPTTSEDLTNIIRLVSFKGKLPQGAPSSPAIANLCAYPLDVELEKLANDNKCVYTRYADDMTFSTTKSTDTFEIKGLIPKIHKIVHKKNFLINFKKTRIQKQNNRMMVTGVVVNKKLSTSKYYWRNFRARLHNLNKSRAPVTKDELQEIRGIAEWIKSLHPVRGNKFLNTIGQLNLID